jgi:tetratricopeptide (TPR) repeat protein
MGWEKRERGRQLYYTRSRRVGDRVIREYLGTGVLAQLAAKTDALDRLRRREEAKAWRAECEGLEATDKALGELYEAVEILTRATLLSASYHQHKGEWRRKRSVDKETPKREEQGVVVPAGKASTPTKGEEVTRSRSELSNELRSLLAQANERDEEAPRLIRRALEETPDSAQILSNIVAKKAERIFVKKLCGDDLLLKEALSLQLETMREEVAGPDPSPLERLLAERVIACWLQLQHAEAAYAANLGKPTTAQSEYHQRRLDRVQRRFLAAIRTLAQVRKLLKPTLTQINVGQQQVNVAAERLESDS